MMNTTRSMLCLCQVRGRIGSGTLEGTSVYRPPHVFGEEKSKMNLRQLCVLETEIHFLQYVFIQLRILFNYLPISVPNFSGLVPADV